MKQSGLQDGYLVCPIAKIRKKRYKKVKLPGDIYKGLARDFMHEDRKNLFINTDKGRAYVPGEWSSRFDKFTKKIGLKVRWHDFARHTRLTHFAEDTKNFFAVLQLSGHQNPAVCKQYFEWANVDVPELEQLPDLPW